MHAHTTYSCMHALTHSRTHTCTNTTHMHTLTDRPLLVEVIEVAGELLLVTVLSISPASDPVDDEVEADLSLLNLTGPHRSSGVMSSDTSSPEAFLADRNNSMGLMASD